MESIISVFNVIANVLKQIIDGFLEFFNTIPNIFNSLGDMITNLIPSEFATYLLALIPIIITLVIIRFVRG